MIREDIRRREGAVDRLDGDEGTLIGRRAADLLTHSSDSVTSELNRARGWLQTQGWLRGGQTTAPSIDWEIEALAGCLGALGNAWGRLSVWSRANGLDELVGEDLDGVMKDLVDVHRQLFSGSEASGAIALLGHAADELEDIQQTLTAQGLPKQ